MQTQHRLGVTSADVGDTGFVEGGTLLEWIDKAAYAAAAQWCGSRCVAASVGNLHLDRRIGVGDLVDLHTGLVHTGRSSMHMLVTLHCDGANGGQTAQCPMIFVALDDAGHPVEVPRWIPATMLDLQRQRQARVRIRMRKRIDDAITAVSDTAAGTAPHATMRFRAATTDLDGNGMIRAGRVMRWIDETAYVCGTDWAGADVIPSYIAGMCFYRPIFVGDLANVTARLIHTGPRSIHLGVKVTSNSSMVAHGVIVVVSLDGRGVARAVPAWKPVSTEDHRLDQHARSLIELREFIEPFTTAFPGQEWSGGGWDQSRSA